MEELSVNINICDRVYPMKVSVDEEADVRAAGKLINERVQAYSRQFGLHDKQDLLAMVAFDCLIKVVKNDQSMVDAGAFSEEINSLIGSLDRVLMS